MQWNVDLQKPHYSKNLEYETSFEEISVPFNEKILKWKPKGPPDSDLPRIHSVASCERFPVLLSFLTFM